MGRFGLEAVDTGREGSLGATRWGQAVKNLGLAGTVRQLLTGE